MGLVLPARPSVMMLMLLLLLLLLLAVMVLGDRGRRTLMLISDVLLLLQ